MMPMRKKARAVLKQKDRVGFLRDCVIRPAG